MTGSPRGSLLASYVVERDKQHCSPVCLLGKQSGEKLLGPRITPLTFAMTLNSFLICSRWVRQAGGRANSNRTTRTTIRSQIKKQNKTGGVDGSLLARVDANELCPPYLPCWWPKSSREDAAMSFVADFQPVRRVMEFAVRCFAFFAALTNMVVSLLSLSRAS